MLYKFFEDTLVSRFIKHLLRSTSLPCFKIAEQSDYIVKDRCYIYNGMIIKCIESGYFEVDPMDYLHPSDNIYPSKFLKPNIDIKNLSEINTLATYKVLTYYDSKNTDFHYNYHSKEMWYDSDTHYHLGEYLRYLKHEHHINLMPYYNCFNYKSTINLKPKPNKKIFLVPVKFNRKYTVAINSPRIFTVEAIIYNKFLGDYTSDIFDTNTDNIFKKQYSYSNFSKPFTITLNNAHNLREASVEKDLCLKFEIDKDLETGLVVLEGDYTQSNRYATTSYPHINDPINLSLLKVDTGVSYAFSSRLIEYLLLHVITEHDLISDNIKRIQKNITDLKINQLDGEAMFNDYYENLQNGVFTYGIWDTELTNKIKIYIDHLINKGYPLIDQDGGINSQLEEYLRKGVV